MKTTTIYSELRNEVFNNGSMDFSQVLDMAAKYTDEILSTDERLWGVDKIISDYGTWTARISFVNEYRFGEEIAEMLKSLPGIVTHDEDAEFSLGDWEEDIEDALVEMIQNICEEEDESEGLSLAERFREERRGLDLPVYLYNGVQGCIYRNNFVSIAELSSMDDVCCDDITVTMDDSYGAYSGCVEIVETDVRCYENEQRLECSWVTKDWAESDEWERELSVDTDDYYDWTSERTRFINALHRDIYLLGEIGDRREQQWEQICEQFSNPLHWEADISYEGIIKQL